jgi:hypothetical protein
MTKTTHGQPKFQNIVSYKTRDSLFLLGTLLPSACFTHPGLPAAKICQQVYLVQVLGVGHCKTPVQSNIGNWEILMVCLGDNFTHCSVPRHVAPKQR